MFAGMNARATTCGPVSAKPSGSVNGSEEARERKGAGTNLISGTHGLGLEAFAPSPTHPALIELARLLGRRAAREFSLQCGEEDSDGPERREGVI
jgi:hypothetical protein